MIRRPPRSTRTDHSFPTRRSSDLHIVVRQTRWRLVDLEEVTTKLNEIFGPPTSSTTDLVNQGYAVWRAADGGAKLTMRLNYLHQMWTSIEVNLTDRSADRRVGKECVSNCRTRWLASR